MIEILDNYLNINDFKMIRTAMMQYDFPWGISKIVDDTKENYLTNLQMVHLFYNRYAPTGDTIQLLNPIFKKIQPFALLRVKANFMTYYPVVREHDMHYDIDDGLELPIKTSILYMNTCDGYTKFENGDIVESIENRLVTFPNTIRHCGTTTSNSPYRMVINFNYV